MGRLTIEQIVSVDGYAAGPDGDISFMTAVDEVDFNDEEQLESLQDVDAILLGATTYRMFAEYWPDASPAPQELMSLGSLRLDLPATVPHERVDAAPG